ncbi:MAG: hypothetical protein Q7T82_18950 [Armatimonadota bacterium]|nr:hypothetical protein [Armatimonadota bacterium]
MRMMETIAIAIACALAACPTWAGTQGKKLVEYGWDRTTTTYVRQNVQEMEKIPLDGVVMTVQNARGDLLGRRVFSRTRFKPEQYRSAIEDLRATEFKRFTDNFIQVLSMPGDVDWFDPEWSAVAHNAACLARVAKKGGCKGIMFDPELYGKVWPWCYTRVPENLRKTRTYEQYRAKVRQRGREFIKAINKEFPDITILALFGMSLPASPMGRGSRVKMETTPYGLLADFYDGIYDAATPRTVFVDGFEFSYKYRKRQQFVEARDTILVKARRVSANPTEFENHVRVGFGVWADFNSGALGWHPEDFTKNYFTPAGLRATLNYALEESDRYVWVYTQRLRWWNGATTTNEYNEALRLAKLGPGPGEPNPLPSWVGATEASKMSGYSDETTFARMRKSMTEIADLPKEGWRFAFDERNTGVAKGYHLEDCNDSSWITAAIGKFWEEQVGIGQYDGRAWYRRVFTAPAVEPGTRVFLAVGAIDDSARVWLNGQFVGEKDIGWDQPYALEITRILRPGQENVLAAQVIDGGGYGGIWKSVKLMAK